MLKGVNRRGAGYLVRSPSKVRRRRLVIIVLILISLGSAGIFGACQRSEVLTLSEDFEDEEVGKPWLDGERHGQWIATYNGYGITQVEHDDGKKLSLSPRSARVPEVTHGGLVLTRKKFQDLDVTVRTRTIRQLRAGAPNPWEVPWLLWHYDDDRHFYSMLLKPNGWELGKEDPAYPGDQRFLQTGSTPAFPIGQWHTIRVRHVGTTITVWGNGRLLTSYTDTERPYRKGRVGLYTEDAHVHFDNVVINRP